MAQSIDEIKKETALIEAETARINAELARLNAQRARSAAEIAPDTTLTDLQKQTSIATAQKDLVAAQTNAKLAELFGEIKAGPYSGAVEIKEKAGTVEATLLAMRAVREAADRIRHQTMAKAGTTLLIMQARHFDSFQRLTMYRFRRQLVMNAMKSALPRQVPGTEAVPAMAIASAGLDAVGKMLGFFKTDFTFAGNDVTVDEMAALFAVAGSFSDVKGPQVILPGTYLLNQQKHALEDLADELSEGARLRDQLVRQLDDDVVAAENLDAQAASESGDAKKKSQERAAALRRRAPEMRAAANLYDAFVASLATPDAAGNTPLAALARDVALSGLIQQQGTTVLLVRLESTGGGHLIKKNLLTGLGAAAPLWHMGGAAMSYVLMDGPTSKVLAGNTVAVHGGYKPSRDIKDAVQ